MMMEQSSVRFAVIVVLTAFVTSQLMVSVSARYLPTRSQDDRLDKLRELLKDLLEGDVDRRATMIDYGDSLVAPGRPAVYKRSTGPFASGPENMLRGPPSLKGIGRFAHEGIPASLFQETQQVRKSMN